MACWIRFNLLARRWVLHTAFPTFVHVKVPCALLPAHCCSERWASTPWGVYSSAAAWSSCIWSIQLLWTAGLGLRQSLGHRIFQDSAPFCEVPPRST